MIVEVFGTSFTNKGDQLMPRAARSPFWSLIHYLLFPRGHGIHLRAGDDRRRLLLSQRARGRGDQQRELADLLRLEPDERVALLIAIGYPDPEGMVAYSTKKALNRLRRYDLE